MIRSFKVFLVKRLVKHRRFVIADFPQISTEVCIAVYFSKMLGCVGVVLYLRIHGCHEQLGGDKGNRMALRLGLCGIRWQCVCIFFQSFQLLGIDKFDRGACYMVAVIDIIEIVGSDVWHVSKQLRETLIY